VRGKVKVRERVKGKALAGMVGVFFFGADADYKSVRIYKWLLAVGCSRFALRVVEGVGVIR
jgi:hypothetical protein